MEHCLDKDSLITIFEHLSMAEKLKCRLVCREWKTSVDKLIAGQHYLEVFAVNSSLAAASIEATGVMSYSNAGHSVLSLNAAIRLLKQLWFSVNAKLLPTSPPAEDNNNNNEANNNIPQVIMNQSIQFSSAMSSSNELDILNICSATSLVNLSSYYWTYAFCASSSLFSSYSFANSTITSHEYFHSFCDCYPRMRHKYSLIVDRKSLSFEMLHNLLTKFANVLSLVMRNVDQLSDVMLFMITQQCHNVQSISFTNCTGLKHEKNNQHAPLNCLTGNIWIKK